MCICRIVNLLEEGAVEKSRIMICYYCQDLLNLSSTCPLPTANALPALESKAGNNRGAVDSESSSEKADDNDPENENGSVDISVPESTLPERRYTKDQWEAAGHKVPWRDLVILIADTNQVTNCRDVPRS